MRNDINSRTNPRPDYGLDAPHVCRGMLTAGVVGIALVIVSGITRSRTEGLTATAAQWSMVVGLLVAIYGAFMGAYMIYASRLGKVRSRETLLDLAEKMRPLNSAENILDIGCGRGLMLIGAARRAVSARVVGIDLWREEDQAENSPAATLHNARLEGVAERVRIDTGDARKLPYDDGEFDMAMSHWVVHNLPDEADRKKALDEMLRVLRPGGVLVLADIEHIPEYRAHLQARGATRLRTLDGGIEAAVMGMLSGGSYRPQAILALR